MCYDIKANLAAQLKRAKQNNDEAAIAEIEKKLMAKTDLPIHHATGFNHPKLLIYTNQSPKIPVVATWGLVPNWTKNELDKEKIWQKTLNARSETIFEKPAFKESAKNKRCLIYVDGFYEHHYHLKKTYPHYVYHANNEPLIFAGLWDNWKSPQTKESLKTFSILTTKGEGLMAEIHNNPKLKEARMPLMLTEELANNWLSDQPDLIEKALNHHAADNLKAHPVKAIKGKNATGNRPEASEAHYYHALEEIQGSLF